MLTYITYMYQLKEGCLQTWTVCTNIKLYTINSLIFTSVEERESSEDIVSERLNDPEKVITLKITIITK